MYGRSTVRLGFTERLCSGDVIMVHSSILVVNLEKWYASVCQVAKTQVHFSMPGSQGAGKMRLSAWGDVEPCFGFSHRPACSN